MLFRAMRKLLSVAPVAAAVALLAGCGGSGGGGGGGNLGEKPGLSGTTVSIIEKDFTLTPGTIALPKPGKYTFTATNEGAQTHNLEVEGHGVEAKGTNIAFGKTLSFTVTFKKAGKYVMYCPVDQHRSFGMEGTVTVASGR
jgi:plastocyanin